MIPITREAAQVLLSRVDLSILEKSDLEYVRYFIKLMEGFMTFSLQKGCNPHDLPFDKGIVHNHLLIRITLRGSLVMMTICQFIYFLQIGIYECLEKLNMFAPPGWSNGQGGRRCQHHGIICRCTKEMYPASHHDQNVARLVPIVGGQRLKNREIESTVFGLMGEFRYKFNRIDDITKFISAMELYLLNQTV